MILRLPSIHLPQQVLTDWVVCLHNEVRVNTMYYLVVDTQQYGCLGSSILPPHPSPPFYRYIHAIRCSERTEDQAPKFNERERAAEGGSTGLSLGWTVANRHQPGPLVVEATGFPLERPKRLTQDMDICSEI